MDDRKTESRFAELALELFGAQAASQFIANVWADASVEKKRELADAVLASVLARVQRMTADQSDWTWSNAINVVLNPLLQRQVEACLNDETVRAEVAAAVDRQWPSAVAATVRRLLDAALERVRSEFGRRA